MFEIVTPWILVLIPLPLLLWLLLPAAKPKQLASLRIPFFQGLQQLTQSSLKQQHRFRGAMWLLWLIWSLLLLAASGPQWVGKPMELPRSGRDIMQQFSVKLLSPENLFKNIPIC